MSNIVIYGSNELSFYLAHKLQQGGYCVKVLFPSFCPTDKNKYDIIFRLSFKVFYISSFDECDTNYFFLCDVVDDFTFFIKLFNLNPNVIFIDCLPDSSDNLSKIFHNLSDKLVRGFSNPIIDKHHLNSQTPKETFFCTDSLIYKDSIKKLGLSIGYNCIYIGGLANYYLIRNLNKLKESINLHEYPGRDIRFYIDIQ